jgi:hypothetical protein
MTARWSNTGGPEEVQIDHDISARRQVLKGPAGQTLIVLDESGDLGL